MKGQIPVNIAAIVPIHNELESTKKFLRSYYNNLARSSLTENCMLIIVDDGSTDGSGEWISEHYPQITVLRSDGSLWWSGSVNMALRFIQQMPMTHFLLFNNDNTLENNYFSSLLIAITEIGHNKIISSKVVNIYPEHHIGNGGVIFDRKRSKYVNNEHPGEKAVVNTAGGMGVLVPVSVVQKIGLFDAINFPQKSGDTDFFLRSEKEGYLVHYCPNLIVYNDNSITGHSENTSIKGIINAYSYPKGYMNLKVDFKLFSRHGNIFWSIYSIIKKNILFLSIGIIRIIQVHLKQAPSSH